jgi:anti-anti-sigma factor
MADQPPVVPEPVRETGFGLRGLGCLLAVAGAGLGCYWWLSATGPYRWLAEWERARWGVQYPGLNALLVVAAPLALGLAAGFVVRTLWPASVRYQVTLPFTVHQVPERDLAVIRFTGVGAPGEGVVRVPGGPALDHIEGHIGAAGWTRVLVNLDGVDFLPSGILGRLIRISRRLSAVGGQLAVCGLQPQVREVFSITKMDRLLNVCDSEQDYMDAH